MTKKTALRLVSLIMLFAAALFVSVALSAPNLGTTLRLGNFVFGREQWYRCYAVYALIMVSLFVASFFCRER